MGRDTERYQLLTLILGDGRRVSTYIPEMFEKGERVVVSKVLVSEAREWGKIADRAKKRRGVKGE